MRSIWPRRWPKSTPQNLAHLLVVNLMAPVLATVIAEEPTPGAVTASQQIRAAFRSLDRDQSQKIDRTEFLARGAARPALERDFRLYDFDGDTLLTLAEFGSVAGVVDPTFRSRMPDPFEQLVDEAVAAMDESYEGWNQRPSELVNAHTFVGNFIASISPGGKRFVTGRILRQADLDSDGRLSRKEAKSFLRHQLGFFRWHDAPTLREPTGRLLRYDSFLEADTDRNSVISREEYQRFFATAEASDPEGTESRFQADDHDNNGSITFAEYAVLGSENFFDPIEWFRGADTNLDATLDPPELAAASDRERHHLVASTFQAFDSSEDGRLSLQEYRLSMHANVNYPWYRRPTDLDRDGRLSYDEFVFHAVDLFQLQRWFYFHRLDIDRDGFLATDEFVFRPRTPFAISLIPKDGNQRGARILYRNAEFPRCGWTNASKTHKSIIFHREAASGLTLGGSRIIVVDMNGENERDLCDGRQPSWSADGTQFVCQRTDDRHRIWIMDRDGRSGHPISEGRAPMWSPDGRRIAFLHDAGLWVYDLETRDKVEILGREDHDFQDLGEDVTWSPDGQRLAVIVRSAGADGSHLLILETSDVPAAPPFRVRSTFDTDCRGDLNWTFPNQILLVAPDPTDENLRKRLVGVDPDGAGPPARVPVLDDGRDYKSACLTPDGQWYIAVSGS